MRVLASITILLPLLVGSGGPHPRTNAGSVAECPFSFDPSLVEGRLLGWLQVEVGRQIAHTRTWSDPDGDTAAVEIIKGPPHVTLVNKPKVNAYTLLWTLQEPMTTAIVLRITDRPQVGLPMTDTGTIVIQVLPRQRRAASSLCGGSRYRTGR
jgi:hypothetical protein